MPKSVKRDVGKTRCKSDVIYANCTLLRNLYVSKRHLLTALKAQEAQTFYDFFAKKYLIMDLKIYTCDCLKNYLTMLELEELDDYLQACSNKKLKHRLSRTLSVSAVVHL